MTPWTYDVIIIGTGAGGGTLARHLAPSGKRILLLERGDWLPREPQNWDTAEVFVDNRYVSADTWYDESGKPFQPQVHYFVGGATKLYGAALYRLRKEDFGELRHHDGISPAWPISYDELEPYYTLAEQLYEVHGARGEDPTEPPASAPVSVPGRLARAADPAARRPARGGGLPPVPRPVRRPPRRGEHAVQPLRPLLPPATASRASSTRSRTPRCSACGRRSSTQRDAADERPGGQARDRCGRAATVTERRRRARRRDRSGTRLDRRRLACGAANTAKLLLVSANDKHPNGLANGSDQVGRNYMFHASQAVLALSRDENPTVFQKTLGLNDFYFGADDFEFPLGNIQMIGKSQPAMFRGEKPGETKLAPEWTLERMAKHAIDFWLSTEDLPRPENRVTVDADGNVRLAYTPTNDEPKKRLYAKLKSILGKLDMDPDHLIHRFAYMKNEIPVAGVAHQAGTCRFGTDPATSVLDADCKAHELDNLYVVDTSIFPSIGAVNPALTAMANALRVGDHLLERMG